MPGKETKRDQADADPSMLVGNTCHGRLVRIRDFLGAMQEFSHEYRALHGQGTRVARTGFALRSHSCRCDQVDAARMKHMFARVTRLLEPGKL